jgi:hypothetical protein
LCYFIYFAKLLAGKKIHPQAMAETRLGSNTGSCAALVMTNQVVVTKHKG